MKIMGMKKQGALLSLWLTTCIISATFSISNTLQPAWAADGSLTPIGTSHAFKTTNLLPVVVKVEGPVQAKVDLQIICLFKHKPQGDTYIEALDDLDLKLHGVLRSLRDRNLFVGNELETILLTPPKNSIGAKKLLIIGLGEENTLSQEKMRRVGVVAFRAAEHLRATHVAFAPTIRDQGNAVLGTGDVAGAVIEGVMSAYDTNKRMQQEGLSPSYKLDLWEMEAGPKFYSDVEATLQKAIGQSVQDLSLQSNAPLLKGSAQEKK
ncbi:MAG: peptidase M17 [Cyanobacteria bacterium]|nr:peptidase M17 [Cyanobacteriota bacterium]